MASEPVRSASVIGLVKARVNDFRSRELPKLLERAAKAGAPVAPPPPARERPERTAAPQTAWFDEPPPPPPPRLRRASCRWRNCRSTSPRPCSTTRPTSPTTSKLLTQDAVGGDPRRQEDLALMDTSALKKFAQEARRALRDQVTAKLDLVLGRGQRGAARGRRRRRQAGKGGPRNLARFQVIEKVAYTWFNRFSALRFMDANGYTGVARALAARGRDAAGNPVGGDGGRHRRGGPLATAEKVRALLDGRAPFARSAGRSLSPARRRRLQPLARAHAVPVRADRRRDRTADARRSAVGVERAGEAARGDDRGGVPGRRDHRLALPVLHLGEEGRGFRGA